MRGAKGSITIFSLISLSLITAALFALLEGTRLQEIRRFADLQTELALESAFAAYNTCLWEKYHVLGTQKDTLEKQVEDIANGRIGKGTNLLQMRVEEIQEKEYVRLTDGKGRVFIRSVATYMSDNWVYEAAKEIYSQYEAIKYLMEDSDLDEKNIGNALKEVEKVKTLDSQRSRRSRTESIVDVETLLKEAKKWKEQGILNFLIKDTSALSTAKQDFGTGVLKRELQKGTEVSEEITWQEWLLFQQYLMTYLANYQNEKEGRALSYEIEYLLAGKEGDMENLNVVALELLAIREAINFVFLVSNPEKMAQAESAAMLVAGASLSATVVEVVKVGILTAWALAESVLDVRALLAGKRIPLLKSEETWTTSLEQLSEVTSADVIAKDVQWGLSYEDYLMVLLLMTKEEDVAMRALNVQEATVRKTYMDTSFGMDSLVTKMELEISYSYQPVFPFLQLIDAEERWDYKVIGHGAYEYY